MTSFLSFIIYTDPGKVLYCKSHLRSQRFCLLIWALCHVPQTIPKNFSFALWQGTLSCWKWPLLLVNTIQSFSAEYCPKHHPALATMPSYHCLSLCHLKMLKKGQGSHVLPLLHDPILMLRSPLLAVERVSMGTLSNTASYVANSNAKLCITARINNFSGLQ